jgi:membrane-associated phospholipid phosphatase
MNRVERVSDLERLRLRSRDIGYALVLLLGTQAVLVTFTWIAAEVFRRSFGAWEVSSIDLPIVRYAAEHRVIWLNHAMQAITRIGNDLSLWATILVAGAILRLITRSWQPLLILIIALVGATFLDRALKIAVARPRPPLNLSLVAENDWSFPSGHATKSAAVYFSLAYLFARNEFGPLVDTLSYALGAGLPILIGVSRVYLGVHWPSDVVAGWALGVIWAAAVLMTVARNTTAVAPRPLI